MSHRRVEVPLPVRPVGCFRPEGGRVVPGLRVTLQRWHLSAGAGDPGRRDPVSSPGDPGASDWGGAQGRRELPGGAQGRCFAGRYRGSAPVRGAGRPSAGRAIRHGPMTTRPNPSRRGSRDATQESPRRLYCCGHCCCRKSSLTLYSNTNFLRPSPALGPNCNWCPRFETSERCQRDPRPPAS